jgi:hypothetical protein
VTATLEGNPVKPTIGRIVLYTLTSDDAKAINQRRDDASAYHAKHARPIRVPGEPGATGHVAHTGNQVREGEEFPRS